MEEAEIVLRRCVPLAEGKFETYLHERENAKKPRAVRLSRPQLPMIVRGGGPATVDGVRPVYRARAAAAPVPYIVLRPATLAPGSFRENNEQ